ncbi:MAG: ATP-dependent zinc metalloprotease FtsH [Parcubacteria group bacterium GW2011_GWA2_47_8b]|nr:MAG: ATP-dependent zinc metalloprotease FtsH [Parcubacteria group bacterium GW2011_GWA2_47_8b]
MKNSKSIFSNIVWAILILLMLSTVFSFVLGPGKEVARLSISELAAKVNSGEVAKIVVNGEDLSVTLKDGSEAAARKENGLGLTETLNNLGVDQKVLQAVAVEVREESGWRFWVGLLIPTLLPLVIIGVMFWFIFRQAKSGASQAFTFGRSNLRLFGTSRDRVTFKDVAGLKEAKQELEEVVDFLKNPKKYLEIGARIPRGVLLMGLPGTGKTLLARAVAGEAGVPFFHISASEFVEMFVGVGASRTRDAFATAKKAAPSILFIDEIDAVGRERGAGLGGGHDEREQTLNQILVEMDGFERDTRVIVLAATNRPDILDRALLRPGRFDRHVILDLPDLADREDILKIHSRGKALDKGLDLRKVAVRTPGFSGADIANLMNEAAILAARHNQKLISQQNLLESIEKVILGPERRGRVISDKEKKITAYHEAGHALVAASLKDADSVHKVSIISRGSAGGYTLKLPSEDMRLRTKSQFVADLATMFGGYASEKAILGDISTGASNDLKTASDLARKLVTKYGMSEKLGPVTFGKSDELVFLGKEISSEKNYSEKMAAEIDEEVSRVINYAYEMAKKIITSRKNALAAIADALMSRETLEQEDFYGILKPFKLKPLAI